MQQTTKDRKRKQMKQEQRRVLCQFVVEEQGEMRMGPASKCVPAESKGERKRNIRVASRP
jgi:hypothetical protein